MPPRRSAAPPPDAVERPAWRERIEEEWRQRRVVWLAGPRRLGKTTLVRSLPGVIYHDCDLPSVRRDAEDAEGFLRRHAGQRLVLDEIHRLADPSTLLKIAADHHPDVHVLATGSSMLGASARFRDTLAGRKRTVRLLPVLHRELAAFDVVQTERRLVRGGLPEQLIARQLPVKDYAEWLEAFWARDILELFAIGKRYSFLRFLELLWAQSGGLCELTKFTAPCEASRQTLANYLDVFAATGVIHVLRPFASHPTREIVAMPKVYAFDTGFVCHARGIDSLRPEDKGGLFEHLVLDELLFEAGDEGIHFWRDKQKHEVDFVWTPRGRAPVAIECKWRAAGFDPTAMESFATLHPQAALWLVAEDCRTWAIRHHRRLDVVECGVAHLPELMARHVRRR
ncbi:MAG: ATP-binding protein [Planctomycetes bacterium]|nr:ATP-binding protein [Planctomycetota bacterium]MBM4059375.1 ATP-binding protein [Planctomycetota bacterium]